MATICLKRLILLLGVSLLEMLRSSSKELPLVVLSDFEIACFATWKMLSCKFNLTFLGRLNSFNFKLQFLHVPLKIEKESLDEYRYSGLTCKISSW